ncbi:uncharacterized protein, partial [Pempheris klunzingeri]|uniref:uncharacterized protein n=1 Tax=Pempheris klunzingeri TaxID=3127111 RepID=UPI003980C92E
MVCRITPTMSFAFMFFMTTAYFLVELAVGYAYRSLVLQADAYHMLSDVVSLVIGFFANRVSINSKGIVINTFGWARSEIVGALINSIFLVALCFSVFIEAISKFTHPEPTDKPLVVLGVAIGDSSKMNMKGVYLHILGDLLGSIIVIISCIILKFFPEVIEIHDFHLWQLTGSKFIATLHIKFKTYENFKN